MQVEVDFTRGWRQIARCTILRQLGKEVCALPHIGFAGDEASQTAAQPVTALVATYGANAYATPIRRPRVVAGAVGVLDFSKVHRVLERVEVRHAHGV